jgi:AcrR family transcriptional regulator
MAARRTHPRRKSAPAALSRERIVEAALALIDRDGLAALSMRRLGTELGYEAMSLYHFFPGKQHLMDALVDRAIGSIEFPPHDMEPIERMRRVMYGYRDMAHRHARLYSVIAVHRLNSPSGVRFIERVLEIAFAATGGNEEHAARSFRSLGYYLMGACLDETLGYANGPSAAQPADDAFIARECPHLVQAAPFFRRAEWDKTFAQGLEDMLAALERPERARKRRLHR